MKRFLFFFASFVLLLTACGPVTPIASPSIPTLLPAALTPSPSPTPMTPVRADLEPIIPENVGKLKQVETWGKGKVYDAQLSWDGSQLAVLTSKGIYIYDTTNYEEQFLELKVGERGGLGFKPDGSEIAYSSDNIYFWNLKDNKAETGKKVPNRIPGATIIELQYSPDGRYLITQSRLGNIAMCEGPGGNLALYEIETGRLLFEKDFCVFGGAYFRIAANNKTYMFFTIAIIGGPAWKIFEIETSSGRILNEIDYPYETEDERILDVSPSGSILSLRAIDFNGMETKFSSRLVDAKSHKPFNYDIKDGFVIFTRNEERRWVIRGSYDDRSQQKGVYELQDYLGNILCSFPQIEVPFSQQFSADGNIALARMPNSEIILWEISTCKPLKSFHFPDPDKGLVFTQNGETLITTNSWTIYTWNVATGEYRSTLPVLSLMGNKPPFGISEDSSSLFTLSEYRDNTNGLEYEFTQVDLKTGIPVKKFGKGDVWTNSIEVSQFQTVATVRSYSDVDIFELWNPDTGEQIASFKDESLLAAYSPDKSKAALVKSDGIKIIDLQTGIILQNVDLLSVTSVNFSTNSILVASIYDEMTSQLFLYRVESDTVNLEPLKISSTNCFSHNLAVSKNYIACILADNRLQVWDLDDLNSDKIMLGHSRIDPNRVNVKLLFTPEGTMLISLGNEYSDDQDSQSTIRFWDLRSGEFMGEIQSKYEIEDLAVSFDGRLLAATCSDGLIRLWGIPIEP